MNFKKSNYGMTTNVSRSIGRNTLFGVLANAAQVGTRLITVPAVIHFLGLGGYGIWNIIMMTATYMRFGSVGVSTAFQKYVAESTGTGDYERASKLLSTGAVMILILSISGLVPVTLLSAHIASTAGVPKTLLKTSAGAISLLAWIMLMANTGAAFEAIVMGGHRIDLVRVFRTVLTVMEAVAIIAVLYSGGGLFAMACVMGASELVYILACYVASSRVVPEIRVRVHLFSTKLVAELVRFAGSYQLVNILEVLYAAIAPFAILRAFGATSAGVFAVVSRIVASAAILQEAFLPPVLSGAAMIYASGSAERMRAVVCKAYKVTLALSLVPLGFIAVFGAWMAYAWTGESHPAFRGAFVLLACTAVFSGISRLAFVLYRVSGKALLDNIWQTLRIALIVVVILFAKQLGFIGVLGGVAVVEMIGMIFMLHVLSRTFQSFRTVFIMRDAIRMGVATALILLAGFTASLVPTIVVDGRMQVIVKLIQSLVACLLVAWPVAVRTGVITAADKTALFGALFVRAGRDTNPIGQGVEV